MRSRKVHAPKSVTTGMPSSTSVRSAHVREEEHRHLHYKLFFALLLKIQKRPIGKRKKIQSNEITLGCATFASDKSHMQREESD